MCLYVGQVFGWIRMERRDISVRQCTVRLLGSKEWSTCWHGRSRQQWQVHVQDAAHDVEVSGIWGTVGYLEHSWSMQKFMIIFFLSTSFVLLIRPCYLQFGILTDLSSEDSSKSPDEVAVRGTDRSYKAQRRSAQTFEGEIDTWSLFMLFILFILVFTVNVRYFV